MVMNPAPTEFIPDPGFDGPAATYMTAADDGWLYAIYNDGTVRGVFEGVGQVRLTAKAYEMHRAAGGVIVAHHDGGTFMIRGAQVPLRIGGYINEVAPAPGGAYLHVISKERRAVEIWYFDGRRATPVKDR